MNTATMICDNTTYTAVSSEPAGRGRPASESSGDGSQPRFADVLPVAQAALEKPAENGPEENAPENGYSEQAQVAAETSVDEDGSTHPRNGRKGKDESESVDPQVTGWPFVEMIHPVVQRMAKGVSAAVPSSAEVAGTGQQATTKPQVSAQTLEGSAQTPSAMPLAQGTVQAGPIPVDTPSGPQSGPKAVQGPQPENEQAVPSTVDSDGMVKVAENVVASTTTPKATEATPNVSTPEKQTFVVPQEVSKEGVASVSQKAQAVQAEQATPNDAGVEGDNIIKAEAVRSSPASQASTSVPQQVEGEKTPTSAKAESKGRQAAMVDKAGPTPNQTPSANSQSASNSGTPAGSEKSRQEKVPTVESPQDSMPKTATASPRESTKASAVQTEPQETSSVGAKETSTTTPDLRISPPADSGAALPSSVTSSQSQTVVDTPLQRSAVQSIGEQIMDSVKASVGHGDREVLVRLNPPELGTVLVRFQEQGDHLSGTLEVSNRDTRREIEQALPQVVRSLQEAGVQIRRVEVVTSDQPDRNLAGEHQSQDVWQQHQGAGQGREHFQGSPQTRWSQSTGTNTSIRQGLSEDQPRTAAAPGRLDLLL